jgi:hypothetical protein
MNFSTRAFRLDSRSWTYRSYAACARFADRSPQERKLDLCTFLQAYWFAFWKVVGKMLKFTGIGIYSLFCLLLLVAVFYAGVMNHVGQGYSLLAAILVTLVKYVGGLAALIAACAAVMWLIYKVAEFAIWWIAPLLRKWGILRSAPREKPARSDGPLRLLSQAIYDRMHGICRTIEVV